MVDGGEDVNPDDDTAPIPVITPDMPNPARATAAADPPVSRIRAPFEPLERKPVDSAPPPPLEPELALPEDAKLDQIKDLYLTAEAIGEDALTKHFEQVSERQRQLIREYFDQVAARGGGGRGDELGDAALGGSAVLAAVVADPGIPWRGWERCPGSG